MLSHVEVKLGHVEPCSGYVEAKLGHVEAKLEKIANLEHPRAILEPSWEALPPALSGAMAS